MSTAQVVVALVAAVLGSSVISAAITATVSWRLGVRGDERAARREEADERRDTVADRDGLIESLMTRVRDLESWRDTAEEHAETRARQLRLALDHADALEDHIWQRKPPPPPARPAGL